MGLQNYYIAQLKKNGLLKDKLKETSIRYALTALTNEVIKTLLLVAIFYLLGALPQFLWTLIFITPVRMATGGFHFTTNIKCFAFSLLFFLCTVILIPSVKEYNSLDTVILLISTAIILILPLYPSKKRPIISHTKYAINKTLSVIFLLLINIILLMGILNWMFALCIVWAMLFQSMQLLYLYVVGIISSTTHQKEDFLYVK